MLSESLSIEGGYEPTATRWALHGALGGNNIPRYFGRPSFAFFVLTMSRDDDDLSSRKS
jgi:hypothetical protein